MSTIDNRSIYSISPWSYVESANNDYLYGSIDVTPMHLSLPISNGKCLLLGCGDGRSMNATGARNKHLEWHGVDFNSEYIEIANESKPDNCTYHCVDFNDFKTDIRFDFVYMPGVFSWVCDKAINGVLNILDKNLNQDGYVSFGYLDTTKWSDIIRIRNFVIEDFNRTNDSVDIILPRCKNYLISEGLYKEEHVREMFFKLNNDRRLLHHFIYQSHIRTYTVDLLNDILSKYKLEFVSRTESTTGQHLITYRKAS